MTYKAQQQFQADADANSPPDEYTSGFFRRPTQRRRIHSITGAQSAQCSQEAHLNIASLVKERMQMAFLLNFDKNISYFTVRHETSILADH